MIEVINKHIDQVAALCRRTGARRLRVFGSAVRANFEPARSDLDFVVEFDALAPAKYVDSYFALKEGLEMLFGRRVDLVTAGSIKNPYFRERVEAESQTIYAR